MIPVVIASMARGLFTRIPCFLEYATGLIYTHHWIPENMQTNTDLYMRLPTFSLAHAEQLYLREKYGDTDAYKAYGLDAYPTFPIELTDEYAKQAAHYTADAHDFIMDRMDCKAETDYEDFRDNFCIDFAKKWCKDNGIPYQYMDKDTR